MVSVYLLSTMEDIWAWIPHASPPLHGFLGLKRKPCFMIKSPIYRSMQDCKSESFHGYIVFKRHLAPDMTQDDIFACTIMEFLMLELKYTHEECEDLDILRITRPGSDSTDKLYLHFATEKSADFLQRRAIAVNAKLNGTDRHRIHTKQFIPPQLYNRHNDLSKYCYERRQANPNFKTRIEIGEEDLILYTKNIGEDWKLTDIHSYGLISPPEWHKTWPRPQLPQMTSPPTGRYPSKKRHRVSGSSTNDTDNEESDNSGHKKSRSHSPESTQVEVHFKHTPPKNSDKSEDGDESNKTLTPINIVKHLPRTINTGNQLMAPGWPKWAKWFKDHPVEALALDLRQQ